MNLTDRIDQLQKDLAAVDAELQRIAAMRERVAGALAFATQLREQGYELSAPEQPAPAVKEE